MFEKIRKKKNPDILTWIGEFRPGNKTIWVVFYVESEFSGPRAQFLSPDRVFWKNEPNKNFEHFEISYFFPTVSVEVV